MMLTIKVGSRKIFQYPDFGAEYMSITYKFCGSDSILDIWLKFLCNIYIFPRLTSVPCPSPYKTRICVHSLMVERDQKRLVSRPRGVRLAE